MAPACLYLPLAALERQSQAQDPAQEEHPAVCGKKRAAAMDAQEDSLPNLAPISKRPRQSENSSSTSNGSCCSSNTSNGSDCSSRTAHQVTTATSPPSDHPVRTNSLSDQYELTEKILGRGQFGTVKECRERATGEALACKTVEMSLFLSKEKSFRSEVELMARVAGHEGIVQLRGVVEEEAQVHLVMDLCRGGELFDEVVRRGQFSEQDSAVIFLQVAHSVAFCHSRGVMHRDLKPENILLTRELPVGVPLCQLLMQGPLVKLADFGFAAKAEHGERLTGVAGSPFYVAPEVLLGEYDNKADVFSLGVILYILLTGEPPFWGKTNSEVFESIVWEEPQFLEKAWKKISLEAKSLVRCCLHKDAARRPTAEKILTHPWFVRQIGKGLSA